MRWSSAVLLLESAKRGDNAQLSDLVKCGADVDATDSSGGLHQVALHFAAASGHWKTVGLLIELGAKINVADTMKVTPMHEAARHGHPAAMRQLIKAGAFVDARDSLGRCPLRKAAEGGHTDCVVQLLDGGADKDAKDDAAWTALHEAAWRGHEDIVEALILVGANLGAVTGEAAGAGGDKTLKINRSSERAADRKAGLTPAALAESAGHVMLLPLLDEQLAIKQARAERQAFLKCRVVHVISSRDERAAEHPWAVDPNKVSREVKEFIETQATALPEGTKVFSPNNWPNGVDETARVATSEERNRDPGTRLLNWIGKIEKAARSGGRLVQVVAQGGLSALQVAEEKLATRHDVPVLRFMCDDLAADDELKFKMLPRLQALEKAMAAKPRAALGAKAETLHAYEAVEIRPEAGKREGAAREGRGRGGAAVDAATSFGRDQPVLAATAAGGAT